MSRLLFNLDLNWYEPKEDSLYVEGWMFSSDEKITKVVVHDRKGEKIPSHIRWKERPDVREAMTDMKVPELPGFKLKLPGVSQYMDRVESLTAQVWHGGTKDTIALVNLEKRRQYIIDTTLAYEVDVLNLLETELVVQGWCVDKRFRDEIRVYDEKGQELSAVLYRTVREDARVKYQDCVEQNHPVGFTLKVPRASIHTPKVKVVFLSDYVRKEYEVDVQEMHLQSSRHGRLYSALRPARFQENREYIREHGLSEFVEKVKSQVFETYSNYTLWVKKHQVLDMEALVQKAHKFRYAPKISIVIPLYNTPIKYLREILDSIVNQSYQNWELCLADGSTKNSVGRYVKARYGRDKRVRYQRLTENKGISENTNVAVAMATGDYIMLSDHDDVVEQGALYEIVKALNENPDLDIIYTDEDKITMDGKSYFDPNFKTDFNPYMMESNNYICHIFVVRASIMEEIRGFRREYDGAQDYDLILRCWEATSLDKICHIPKVLYHWRSHPNSTATNPESKRYAFEAGANALDAHFARKGILAKAEITDHLGIYRVHRQVEGNPLVSIIIPNKDHTEDLNTCLTSVTEKTTYDNYEILVVENNSTQPETFDYYKKMQEDFPRVRLLTWEKEFNYAAINNYAAKNAKGEYLLFLNNDIELITEDWIQEMLGICQSPEVGMVGAKLYFPDETIQHAGVTMGLGGVAGHIFSGASRFEPSYMGWAIVPRNVSAVTAACALMKRSVFDEVEGFDEGFRVAFNDVDLCMKTTRAGYQIVWTPYAELYHYESKSRGMEDTGDKQSRFYQEVYRFETKWPEILKEGDPFYNVNLSLKNGNCTVRE